MNSRNQAVYIFAATLAGSSKGEYLKKAGFTGTPQRKEFLEIALKGKERDFADKEVVVVPPGLWIGGEINPAIRYASNLCDAFVDKAQQYMIRQGIVEDTGSLESLGKGVTLDEWYKLVYVAYLIDTDAKRAVKAL